MQRSSESWIERAIQVDHTIDRIVEGLVAGGVYQTAVLGIVLVVAVGLVWRTSAAHSPRQDPDRPLIRSRRARRMVQERPSARAGVKSPVPNTLAVFRPATIRCPRARHSHNRQRKICRAPHVGARLPHPALEHRTTHPASEFSTIPRASFSRRSPLSTMPWDGATTFTPCCRSTQRAQCNSKYRCYSKNGPHGGPGALPRGRDTGIRSLASSLWLAHPPQSTGA